MTISDYARDKAMEQLEGGCSCGLVRFKLNRGSLWTNICHCNACKRRTGSAFGFSVVVESADVTEFTGQTATFARSGESGRFVHYEFCPRCGTTLRWHVEILPGRQVFAGGTFDDAYQFDVAGEMYTDKALPWSRIGRELACPGAPDDQFRKAALSKSGAPKAAAPKYVAALDTASRS